MSQTDNTVTATPEQVSYYQEPTPAFLYSPENVPIYSPTGLPQLSAIGDASNFLNDPMTPQGVLNVNPLAVSTTETLNSVVQSYTGADLKIVLELADAYLPNKMNIKLSKQLIEATTFSVSVHRVKAPVRACGYINPKGFARGTRTIAGTIVLTQMTVDVLYRFLQATLWNDTSKDSGFTKVDQLPPFNMTMIWANERGDASYRRVLGVDLLTDGVVYSVNDMLTEQAISYQAADFTPLLPFSYSAQSQTPSRTSASASKTVTDAMLSKQASQQSRFGLFVKRGSGS